MVHTTNHLITEQYLNAITAHKARSIEPVNRANAFSLPPDYLTYTSTKSLKRGRSSFVGYLVQELCPSILMCLVEQKGL